MTAAERTKMGSWEQKIWEEFFDAMKKERQNQEATWWLEAELRKMKE